MLAAQSHVELVGLVWKGVGAILLILLGVIGFFCRRAFKRWDEDAVKLEARVDKLDKKVDEVVSALLTKIEDCRTFLTEEIIPYMRKEIDDVKDEWASLRAHIPEHYLPRTDFIRDNTVLDGKVSALFRKFDRIEVKLDFLREQFEKRAQPDDGGEDAT